MSADLSQSIAARFTLEADAFPGLLSRLLEPFAKRDLIPDRVSSHRDRDAVLVEIVMNAMPRDMVHLVEGNIRQVVGVRSLSRIDEAELRHAA